MMTGISQLFGGSQRREAPTGPAIVFGPAVQADGKKFIPVSEERGWRGAPLGMLVVDEHGSDYVPVPRRPPLGLLLVVAVLMVVLIELVGRIRRG